METSELEQFQNFIDDLILRNKSILDQMTKLQDASARLNRTISKAATTCGCVVVTASKQPYPAVITQEICLEDLKSLMHTQVDGFLCPTCQEQIEKEMGRCLFYLGALANTLGISLSSVLENEKTRTNLLGKYCLK
ncbi:MAG: hypothetical protein ACRCW2_08355 [Cellulosilyticaceae bacterium]